MIRKFLTGAALPFLVVGLFYSLSPAQSIQLVTPGLTYGGDCRGVVISSSAATEVVGCSTCTYSNIFVQNITAPSTAAIYGAYSSSRISTAAATGSGIILQGGTPSDPTKAGGVASIPLKSNTSFYFMCNAVGYACRATVCPTR